MSDDLFRSGVRRGCPTTFIIAGHPERKRQSGSDRGIPPCNEKRNSNHMIEVRHLSGNKYEVKVSDATTTTHRVTLQETDRQRLGGKDVSAERLVEESFRFLLEREPNTSILNSFELPLIGKYFPQYAREIRERLRQG